MITEGDLSRASTLLNILLEQRCKDPLDAADIPKLRPFYKVPIAKEFGQASRPGMRRFLFLGAN